MAGDLTRRAAIEAMVAAYQNQPAWQVRTLAQMMGDCLDAIPVSVLAELAVERGGMEPVESYHDVICPLFIWEHDPDLFDEKPGDCGCHPVFRLTKQTSP